MNNYESTINNYLKAWEKTIRLNLCDFKNR